MSNHLFAFKEDTELTLVTGFDEATDTITEEEDEFFRAGEIFEADVIPSDRRGYVDLQFGDGSVAFGVNLKAFASVTVKVK